MHGAVRPMFRACTASLTADDGEVHVVCVVYVRPISGARRHGAGRALRLASRGFGNRQITFTPRRHDVHVPCAGRLACSRKSAAFHARAFGRRLGRARFGTGGRALIAATRLKRRLRRVGGAMLSSRAASHPHPPLHPHRGGAHPPCRHSPPVPPPSCFGPQMVSSFWFLVSYLPAVLSAVALAEAETLAKAGF